RAGPGMHAADVRRLAMSDHDRVQPPHVLLDAAVGPVGPDDQLVAPVGVAAPGAQHEVDVTVAQRARPAPVAAEPGANVAEDEDAVMVSVRSPLVAADPLRARDGSDVRATAGRALAV